MMLRTTIVALCLCASTTGFGRTWVSEGGNFRTEAKLVRVKGQRVLLENPKGKQLWVSIRKLSRNDQDYIKAWLANESGNQSQQSTPTEVTPITGTLFGKPFESKLVKPDGSGFTVQADDEFMSREYVSVSLLGIDDLGGKTVRVSPRTKHGVPIVRMRSSKDGDTQRITLMNGYSMKLQVGDWRADRTALAMFQFSVPKHNTKLSGVFEVEKSFDPKADLEAIDRPFVLGKVVTTDIRSPDLRAGYVGITKAGKEASNMAGTTFGASGGWAACLTYKPRITAIYRKGKSSYGFKHVKLEPGRYFFYANWNEGCVTGKWVDISADSETNLDLELDGSQTGRLEVEVQNSKARERVVAVPVDLFGSEPNSVDLAKTVGLTQKIQGGGVTFESLLPGRYRVVRDKLEKEITVKPNQTVRLAL